MYASRRERMASALASLMVVLLIANVLVFGLRVDVKARVSQALVSVFLEPPKPPQERKRQVRQPQARKQKSSAAKGAPSPRNLRNKATPVVAPPPPRPPLVVPPPIVAATQPGIGQAASNGASNRPGPGQGAGGIGNGNGGGGNGGEGEGNGVGTEPRQIKGHLSFKDAPEGLLQPGRETTVGVRYLVDIDGRVIDCRVDQPSGIAALDALTCQLIEQRFRFRPARDRSGRPVRATIVESHTWIAENDQG